MKRIIRDRHLTSEEVERNNRIRKQVEKDFPPLRLEEERLASDDELETTSESENEIELEPEDEKILDKVWEDVFKSERERAERKYGLKYSRLDGWRSFFRYILG
jgi:hypothetical protein